MKERDEVITNGRSAFYCVLYNEFRQAAMDCGYALSVHGSLLSDMDLIAVPWIEEAKPIEELVKSISDCIGSTIWKGHHFKDPKEKPHGRIVYTLSIFSDWYIDLSIIKPKKNPL